MCYHVYDFPSPVIHFNMFPTLREYKSACGAHLALHSGTMRWLSDAHREIWQALLLTVRPTHCWQSEINVSLVPRNSIESVYMLVSRLTMKNIPFLAQARRRGAVWVPLIIIKSKNSLCSTGDLVKGQMHAHTQTQTKSSLIGLEQLLLGRFTDHGGRVRW